MQNSNTTISEDQMLNFKGLLDNGNNEVVKGLIEQMQELNSPMQFAVEEIIKAFLYCFAYLCDASSLHGEDTKVGSMAQSILESFDSELGQRFYKDGRKSKSISASEAETIKRSPILASHFYRIMPVLNGQVSRERMHYAYEKSRVGQNTLQQIWVKHHKCFNQLSQNASEEKVAVVKLVAQFFSLIAYQNSEASILRDEMKKMVAVGKTQNAGTCKFIVPGEMDPVSYFAKKFEKLFFLAGQYQEVHRRVYRFGSKSFSQRTDYLLRATYFILRDNLKQYAGVSGESIIKEVLTALVTDGEDAAWETFTRKLSLYPNMIPEWAIEKYCLQEVVGPDRLIPAKIARQIEISKAVFKDKQRAAKETQRLNALQELTAAELRYTALNGDNIRNVLDEVEYKSVLDLIGESLTFPSLESDGKKQEVVFSNTRYASSPHVYMMRKVSDANTGEVVDLSRKITLFHCCLHLMHGDLTTLDFYMSPKERMAKLLQSPVVSLELASAINCYFSEIEKEVIKSYLQRAMVNYPADKAEETLEILLAKL